jgi:hypothetical protein
MKRDVIERPFERELVRTRRGNFGAALSYVEGPEYIRRLNEAFDGMWSFEVVEYQILERDVIVLGRLQAGGVVKVAFGGASIKRGAQTNESLNLADDLKAAATDALKKACSLLGIGLHLYAESMTADDRGEAGDRAPVTRSAVGAPAAMTERQLKAIFAIGRSLGWSADVLRQHSIDAFGVPPDELTKADASALIDELHQMATKAAA